MSQNQLVLSPPSPQEPSPRSIWRRSNWKLHGVRVWVRDALPGEPGPLYRVGEFGSEYFYTYSKDRVPNLINQPAAGCFRG
jgi:hypothetical protein